MNTRVSASGEEHLDIVEFSLQCRIHPEKGIQCRVLKLQPMEHVEIIEQKEKVDVSERPVCHPRTHHDEEPDEDEVDVTSCLENAHGSIEDVGADQENSSDDIDDEDEEESG